MRCREFEAQLCEYLDRSLGLDELRAADEHLLSCSACAEFHAEAEFASSALKRAAAIEPPPELIAAIIHSTIGYAGRTPPSSQVATHADSPARAAGFFGFLRPLLSPILQPRFVMSMAMTVISFSMLTFQAQHLWQSWRLGEFSLSETKATIEQRTDEAWRQALEMYDAALLFYELQTSFGEDAEPRQGEGPQDGRDGK